MTYSLGVDATGHFVFVGQDDGNLSVLALSRTTGLLNKIEGSPFPFGGLQPEITFALR